MMTYPEPRMHTTGHILNQTMDRLYDCGRCFNADIGKVESKLDYRFDHILNDQEITDIQSWVNKVIKFNMQVTESFVSKYFAEMFYAKNKLSNGPNDKIRVIRIGGYDAHPCTGQHVRSTADIGTFKIASTRFEDGILSIGYKLF